MSESRYKLHPLDLGDISTYPLASRESKVSTELFGRPASATDTVSSFVGKLPRILAGEAFRNLVRAIQSARQDGQALLWGMGGHVVKCGLGPVFIDMMRDGFVSGIAMNGAAMIHDFEVALKGATSEDVENELKSGRFGMAQETGEYLNRAINEGHNRGLGAGESVGAFFANQGGGSRMQPP